MADVARTFGVSEEQLARDLELVYMCGLPGYFPGDLIEVDITASGRITVSNADPMSRPLRLSRDEALPLIVGLRMLADLPGLRDPDRFDAWLHRLLVRSCIDESRRLRRHRIDLALSTLDAPVAADHVSAVADRDQLERGFVRLEPEMRAVIVLHHYLDLPLPEVAVTLGIPIGTVKSRLHRGLGLLRAALDADARSGQGISEGRPA
jgi:RNA polymerase sigma factor (sigma-70 family)